MPQGNTDPYPELESGALAVGSPAKDPGGFGRSTLSSVMTTVRSDSWREVTVPFVDLGPSSAPIRSALLEDLATLIDQGAAVSLEEGLRMELAHLTEIFSTKDALAGLLSVGGKSRPPFEGR
jgi:serine/threonine protein kinase HipA of HipAB toxin-antitoxin module